MTIIAEIGTAHSGAIDKAFSLIDAAKDAGADCVKFQWVYADEILHPDTGFVQLPGGSIRLYDRFRQLEVDSTFFSRCLDYAHKQGLLFACSPFGLRSLEELAALHPDAIKIASAEVNHYPLLNAVKNYYGTIPIILSSGVSKLGDIEKAVDILEENNGGQSKQELPLSPLTLLHCITFYPAPEEEYNVRCIDTLKRTFGIPAGLSDHSLDPVLIPVLSAAVGGTMIEKHITLSRETDGLDDPVALEPEQFAQMVQAVHQTSALINRYKKDALAAGTPPAEDDEVPPPAKAEILRQMTAQYGEQKVKAALGTGVKRLAKSELANYGRTNRSLHYLRDMKQGENVTAHDIAVLRTEKVLTPGVSPALLDQLIGGILQRDVTSGAGVVLTDFIEKT